MALKPCLRASKGIAMRMPAMHACKKTCPAMSRGKGFFMSGQPAPTALSNVTARQKRLRFGFGQRIDLAQSPVHHVAAGLGLV